jgi:outer membrane receptor for ferrienterochelin and colicin
MAGEPKQTIKDVVTDFLASGPSIDDIIAYRLPGSLQERAQYLLDKNRGEGLTPAERQEMDEFLQIDHLMALVKAKARLKRLGRA